MKTLESMIAELDTEVGELKNDTNRWVRLFAEQLIQLSKFYAKSKRDYQKSKTSYDLAYIKAKEDREKDLNKANELIDDEKKKVKITDAELERAAKSSLTRDYQTMMDHREDEVYLEPILRAYLEYMNAVKHDQKTVIQETNFYNNNQ